MQNHAFYICLAFRHCGFSNVASTRLHEKRQTYIAGICWSFHRCVFSNVFLNGLHNKRHSQIGCICGVQLHCQLFSYGFLHLHPLKKSNNFPLVWLPFCVVLCPNDCFKLSQIHHWLLVSKCKVFHDILSLFSCIGDWDWDWLWLEWCIASLLRIVPKNIRNFRQLKVTRMHSARRA